MSSEEDAEYDPYFKEIVADAFVKAFDRIRQLEDKVAALEERGRHRQHWRPPAALMAIIRDVVFTRDRRTCRYCGVKMAIGYLQLDHVIPQSAGGTDEIGNLVTACVACNQQKGARSLSECGMALLPEPRTEPTA